MSEKKTEKPKTEKKMKTPEQLVTAHTEKIEKAVDKTEAMLLKVEKLVKSRKYPATSTDVENVTGYVEEFVGAWLNRMQTSQAVAVKKFQLKK